MTAPSRLLLSVFPTFAAGGAQVRFASIANALGERWRHAIIAIDGEIGCRERLSPDLDVTFPILGRTKGSLVGLLARLRTVLGEVRPDAMLTHNWGSIDWALANLASVRRVPHIHAEDGFGPEERARQLPRRVWTRRLALRRALVVLPSRTLFEIARHQWRLPARRLHYVPNGIDLARFIHRARQPPPKAWGLSDGTFVIGTVAALRPEKNLARLIEAVAHARRRGANGLRLVIAGEGAERPALERLAASILEPGGAAFLGHLSDPAPIYDHFDAFALSSDTEQMPLSLLEAMASGLPVAATDVGDVSSMVAGVNRPFVTPCDTTALGDALAGLAADPRRARAIGAANRARVSREYDQSQMIQTWAGLLDREAGSIAPRRPTTPLRFVNERTKV